mmetsp:Transcript_22816/g.52030  ORF Transcript_22816/g.52030 Transcript_22816/m.52030 type:complete len:285 (+) Transcript_22816:2-856(+)
MGGDGGCVATRADMVKTKGYGFKSKAKGGMGYEAQTIGRVEDETYDPRKLRQLRMATCRLSEHPFRAPLMACRLGHLYNKEVVVRHLLSKTMPPAFRHIRALKHVKDVVHPKVEGLSELGGERLVCPVTRLDLDNGSTKAVLLWSCGCVMAARCLDAQKKSEKQCMNCDKLYTEEDIVKLAVDDEELEALQDKIDAAEEERLTAKAKKTKAKAAAAAAANPAAEVPAEAPAAKKQKTAKAEKPAGKEQSATLSSLFCKKARPNSLMEDGAKQLFGCFTNKGVGV